jgi:hypothetical protein
MKQIFKMKRQQTNEQVVKHEDIKELIIKKEKQQLNEKISELAKNDSLSLLRKARYVSFADKQKSECWDNRVCVKNPAMSEKGSVIEFSDEDGSVKFDTNQITDIYCSSYCNDTCGVDEKGNELRCFMLTLTTVNEEKEKYIFGIRFVVAITK